MSDRVSGVHSRVEVLFMQLTLIHSRSIKSLFEHCMQHDLPWFGWFGLLVHHAFSNAVRKTQRCLTFSFNVNHLAVSGTTFRWCTAASRAHGSMDARRGDARLPISRNRNPKGQNERYSHQCSCGRTSLQRSGPLLVNGEVRAWYIAYCSSQVSSRKRYTIRFCYEWE